jgi:hypothetical protein
VLKRRACVTTAPRVTAVLLYITVWLVLGALLPRPVSAPKAGLVRLGSLV